MKKNYFFTLLFLMICTISFGQIVINEIDSDQTGTDSSEFIELKWTANTSLDGYVVVLFNGSDDRSYSAYDLDGKSTDANGFFILATSSLATAADVDMGANNAIQNGADAVAVYQANETDFPNDTPITTTNLIDVVVYGTSDGNDSGLLTGFNKSVQYDENLNSNKDTESIQRHTNGTYQVLAPTFRAENNTSNAASLNITAPTNNKKYSPGTTEVTVSFTVGNFNVAAGGSGDGYIKYKLDAGTATSKFDTNDITLSSLTAGDHTVELELVDNSGNPLATAVKSSVSFSIETFTQVTNLTGLRGGTQGKYYEVTGEVVLTYNTGNSRNQKYILDKDGTAAILIDDSAGKITTTYNVADGITGLKGRLGAFNGVLQLVPSEDPGAATSTGNTISNVQVATLNDLKNNPDTYESKPIVIEEVTFDDANGTATFGQSKNYTISKNSETGTFRTQFSSATFIGNVIPSGTQRVIGIASEFSNKGQIYGTKIESMTTASVDKNSIEGFAVYPNPISQATFKLTTASFASKQVQIFNVLGKEVLTEKVNGTSNDINITSLTSGIYILKVVEEGKTATKKLIIK